MQSNVLLNGAEKNTHPDFYRLLIFKLFVHFLKVLSSFVKLLAFFVPFCSLCNFVVCAVELSMCGVGPVQRPLYYSERRGPDGSSERPGLPVVRGQDSPVVGERWLCGEAVREGRPQGEVASGIAGLTAATGS